MDKEQELGKEIETEAELEGDQKAEETTPTDEAEKQKEPSAGEMTREELISKLEELEETAKKNYDLYVRSQAEIENMKKRFNKEKEDLAKFSNQSLIKQILPVLDSLEQALEHSSNEESLPALKEGVELTLKSLKDSLKKAGVERVKSEGKPFDPNYHEALAEQEDEDKSPGTVVKEFQKGYLLNDRLLRPAKVIVSKEKRAEEPADNN